MKKVEMIDFNGDEEIIFKHASLLGSNGLITDTVNIKRSTLPRTKGTTYFCYFVKDRINPSVAYRASYVHADELCKLRLFITCSQINCLRNSLTFDLVENDLKIDEKSPIIYRNDFQNQMDILKAKDVEREERENAKIPKDGTRIIKEVGEFSVVKIRLFKKWHEVLYTEYVLRDEYYSGYRYYVVYDKEQKVPAFITNKFTDISKICGTIFSPVPINMFGSVARFSFYEFRYTGAVVWSSRYASWLDGKDHDSDQKEFRILDHIKMLIEEEYIEDGFIDKYDSAKYLQSNTLVFAKALKFKLGRGTIGCVGRSMRCVWIDDETGRAYNANGRVEDAIIIDPKTVDHAFDIIVGIRKLPQGEYEEAINRAKNYYPNA